jgi:hypothetical protein
VDADRYLVHTLRTSLIASVLLAVLAACGSSQPPAGQAQAQAACKSSGSQAATLASQAATANPKYATLSADESALASREATQENELSDGNPSDDSGLGALAGADSIGDSGDMKVLSDCVSLGLSVTH